MASDPQYPKARKTLDLINTEAFPLICRLRLYYVSWSTVSKLSIKRGCMVWQMRWSWNGLQAGLRISQPPVFFFLWRGGGVLNILILLQGWSVPRSTPLPFYIPLSNKKVPLSYTWIKALHAFSTVRVPGGVVRAWEPYNYFRLGAWSPVVSLLGAIILFYCGAWTPCFQILIALRWPGAL